jgi:hypothetical protein
MPPAIARRTSQRTSSLSTSANKSHLFQPSIYSFSCHGSYAVSTSIPSKMIDSAEQLLLQQQGRCRGLQSQLELVANAQLPVSSRQAALKEFHQWVLEHTGMDDVNIAEPLVDAVSDNAAMHLGKKAIMVPPMLIHKQNKRSEREGSGPKPTDIAISSSRRPH